MISKPIVLGIVTLQDQLLSLDNSLGIRLLAARSTGFDNGIELVGLHTHLFYYGY